MVWARHDQFRHDFRRDHFKMAILIMRGSLLRVGHSSGERGSPSIIFLAVAFQLSTHFSNFKFDHFAHNNHGDGSGYGMERIEGQHNQLPAATPSVDRCGLMMSRNHGDNTRNLYFGGRLHEVTVILMQMQQQHRPPHEQRTFRP